MRHGLGLPMSVEASSRPALVTAMPGLPTRPYDTVGRLAVVLVLLVLAWVALGHVGGYHIYWARLFAVAIALIAWWSPGLAIFGLAIAALVPVAISTPGVALLALAAFMILLLVFADSPHALALVLATPVFLQFGVGPLPVFLLLGLGEVRRGPWASLGVLLSLALVVGAGQTWAGGYLTWGLSGVGDPLVQLPIGEQSWSEIVERLGATPWENVWPEAQSVAMILAGVILNSPLISAQALVWLIAPAFGLVIRRSVLVRYGLPGTAQRNNPQPPVIRLFSDLTALLVAWLVIVLGHLLAAPLFTNEAVTPEYESAVLANAVWSLLFTSAVVAVDHLIFRRTR